MCACGGNSKLIIDDYVIRTRIPECREIILKNVRYRQCKICGQMELTEDSQKMIDLLREHYMKMYYERKEYQNEDSIEEAVSTKVKKIFNLFRL